MKIERAIEVFVGGFSFVKSIPHPYEAEWVDGLWLMRDAPRKRGDYRNEEYVAHGLAPEAVDEIARRRTRGRYKVSAIRAVEEPEEPLRAGYRALGYRLLGTEPFMVHALRQLPDLPEPLPVKRVDNHELAAAIGKQVRRKPLDPAYYGADSPLRKYAAVDGDRPVGWVSSIRVGDAAWCSGMFVQPEYRRRGIGRSLLARMLRDDRAAGLAANVLLATHTGAKLYPTFGYELIGELLLYSPASRTPR